jgi:triphosphoribosyl-dephospho-CoA synthase
VAGRAREGAFAALDRWLRGDGNRRNPGTSADLIAAGLFAVLREGRLRPPFEGFERPSL